jgi:RimJ/RimL family protein N-acetyltransferase
MDIPALTLTVVLLAALSAQSQPQDADSQEAPAIDTAEGEHPSSPWFDPDFTPPAGLETGRVVLEPLAPRHAALDHAALMGSREHLQRTLQWGDWPSEEFTVEENRGDLERHWKEFEAREGYAFTVLSPDRSTCLGCIYLEPADGKDPSSRNARFAYWVVEDRLDEDLDRHLLEAVLAWIRRDWPLETLALQLRVENERGATIARDLGLQPLEGARVPDHRIFIWER